jgi:hypothetical protein
MCFDTSVSFSDRVGHGAWLVYIEFMHKILVFCLLVGVFGSSSTALSQARCWHVFTKKEEVKVSEIHFTQDFIGVAWALTKLNDLQRKYKKWQSSHENGNAAQYILERTRSKKTIPAIRDIQGNIRIVDNHHSFFSYMMLLLGNQRGEVVVRIEKDYTTLNGQSMSPWTSEEFMIDMRANNWVNFMDSDSPSWVELQGLPTRIEDLNDNPLRSLLSMTLRALPVPLKGSDFINHGQNVILDFIGPRVQEFSADGADPVSKKNIENLRDMILEGRQILEEIRANLSPGLGSKRQEKIDEFLQEAIENLS